MQLAAVAVVRTPGWLGLVVCVGALSSRAAAEPRLLGELSFERRSAALAERLALAHVVTWAAAHPDATIVVGGHADRAEPLRLSLARAEVVRRALVEDGVNPDQIVVSTYTGTRPRVVIWATESR
ncbi:MAG TPA: OmpA family protein [Kofleriaceae bacterium]|nr:OmpA family protein [Kofleriaceae bacterium]